MFPASWQNLCVRKFKYDREVTTAVTRWLIKHKIRNNTKNEGKGLIPQYDKCFSHDGNELLK